MEIKIAKTKIEKEAIFLFRYEIYINELGKFFLNKNKADNKFSDELDDDAYIIYSEDQSGNIIGCVRFLIQCQDERLTRKYKLQKDFQDNKLIQIDRFMIDKKHRGSSLSLRFMLWMYKFALKCNVHTCLIEVEPHLVKLYQKLGFVEYDESYVNNDKSRRRILCFLELRDKNALEKVGSPLLAILNTHDQRSTVES